MLMAPGICPSAYRDAKALAVSDDREDLCGLDVEGVFKEVTSDWIITPRGMGVGGRVRVVRDVAGLRQAILDANATTDADTIQVSIAHPYPGTEFYDYVKQNGLITIDSMTDEQGHQLPNIRYENLDRAELVDDAVAIAVNGKAALVVVTLTGVDGFGAPCS